MLRKFAAIALAAGALAGVAAASPPTIAKPLPVATLQAETAAFNQKNWPSAYSAYTSGYQARCPFATFTKNMAKLRSQFAGPVSIRMKSTKVSGDKAWLRYSLVYRGKVVATTPAAHPDLYTRIGGLWFDDYEGSTVCD